MEEQIDLKKVPVGTIEKKKLEPAKVKIVKTEVEFVEKAKNNKLVCTVKHPDAAEEINISSVKFEKAGKIISSGLWFSLDSEEKLSKDSGLGILLRRYSCANVEALQDLEIDTTEDEKGYLCFKAY